MVVVWSLGLGFRFFVICLFDLGDLLAVILLGMSLLEVEADAKG